VIELTLREQAALFRTLEEVAGFQFSEGALLTVQRRIGERIAASGLGSCTRYLEYITSAAGQQELAAALDAVTTSETYFLRQHYQLRAFEEEVLPWVVEQNSRFRKLTIWSAGCSTGEEPYSLATIVASSHLLLDWKVRILGSDLSQARLAIAREGRYGRSSFRATDEAFKQRYFTPGPGEGEWTVNPEIRRLCSFVQTNLAVPGGSSVIGTVDVAFCRNVLIYLSPRARELATSQLVERLPVGGYLFLGHAESLLNSSLPIEALHLKEDVVYRRTGGNR
jgi:chemotaxis protein methyltransferase CheR